MTRYDEIEDGFVNRLAVLRTYEWEVQAFPDNKARFELQAGKPRITVAYNNSYYGDSNSPGRPAILSMGGTMAQEQFVEIVVAIESKSLRGPRGVYQGYEYIRTLLLGWSPSPEFRKASFLREEFEEHDAGRFKFSLVVLTSRLVIESQTEIGPGGLNPEDDPETPPLFLEGSADITC
jgi:hypothetical protein